MNRVAPRGPDAVRQVAVAASAVVAVVGSLIGSGAFIGTPIAEAAGGALAADATLVAPAGPAFSIWSVIYTGLVALAVWQLLPSHRGDRRQREVGWLVASSMLLNAAWIAVVQLGWLFVSVAVIAALLATVATVFVKLRRSRPSGWLEAAVVDGTMGLYLGWVCIATVANVAAALAGTGLSDALSPDTWAVLVLTVAGVVGVALAVFGGGRLSVAAALGWGLLWVAVARLNGDPASGAAAVAAAAAAVATVVSAVLFRVRAVATSA